MRNKIAALLYLVSCVLLLASCQTIDIYEKNAAIPNHEWKSSFKPQFKFIIKDTTSTYQLFLVIRHNEKYNWNNIWINLEGQMPGKSLEKIKIELPLTDEKGWLGTAMDDLYEHRIPLTIDPEKLNFESVGEYSFTLEQIMREDPLLNVMNIGLRIEKKSQ